MRKFEHTGVQHEQDTHTGHVYTHQDQYALELSEIDAKHVDITNPDDPCTEEMHERYRSLLGASAWLLMSRANIAPLIGHLQRHAHKPQNKHLK
eukprot:1371262-Prorocentrum_lima.AAC.1